jgi:hypothetical protein
VEKSNTEYTVPFPENDEFRRHDAALYSMWMHFCDFCQEQPQQQQQQNKYTGQPRMAIFKMLSEKASSSKKTKEDEEEVWQGGLWKWFG